MDDSRALSPYCSLGIYLLIYLFREGEGGEGQRENLKQASRPQHGALRGAQPHNPEIVTQAEVKSSAFNQLSQPGTLEFIILIFVSLKLLTLLLLYSSMSFGKLHSLDIFFRSHLM